MSWFTEPAKRRDLILGMILVVGISLFYSRWSIGQHAQSIMESANSIREAVNELKSLTISQTNNQQINLPPTEAELNDRLKRDIIRSQGHLAGDKK